jgi:lambda family phage portal protein
MIKAITSLLRRLLHVARRGIRFPRPVSRYALKGGYDAASLTHDNRRHWSRADSMSPAAANNPAVRKTLRDRARYEVANNSYAWGIVSTLANDVIGTGPRLQMLTPDEELNAFLEAEFRSWARTIGLGELLRTFLISKIRDGEAFAIIFDNTTVEHPVKLDLKLVEADQVSTPTSLAWSSLVGANYDDGIVFDKFGNPKEYHVLRYHPGDNWFAPDEYDTVPAEFVIHYFTAMRAGQRRGIPDITPAIPLFAQLRRYTLAVLAAAETAADFAGVLYTDAPPDGQVMESEPFEPVEIEKRALLTLPAGWKVGQLDAKQPSTTYSEFKREVLNEIARCLNMPYNVAAANSSSYNYASGRLDYQVYYKAIRVERSAIERVVLAKILRLWLREASVAYKAMPVNLFFETPEVSWFWDGQEHVDPVKEAQAQQIRLQNHTTTLAHEYARMGRDWQEALRQRARELQLMRELGLTDNGSGNQPEPQNDGELGETEDATTDAQAR